MSKLFWYLWFLIIIGIVTPIIFLNIYLSDSKLLGALINQKWIFVRVEGVDFVDIDYIVYHEIGHKLYGSCITNHFKERYFNLYNLSLCNYKEDIDEDFAISYGYYKTSGGLCSDKIIYFYEMEKEVKC